jgi:branched-chain amino acid transport system permease protein
LLDNRLQELSTSETIAGLPAVLRVPLSQPVFVLGLLFVLVVYFAPGGIVAIGGRVRAARARRAGPRGDAEAAPPAGGGGGGQTSG